MASTQHDDARRSGGGPRAPAGTAAGPPGAPRRGALGAGLGRAAAGGALALGALGAPGAGGAPPARAGEPEAEEPSRMRVEDRLRALGLTLPPPLAPPPGLRFAFAQVRVRGRRAYVAGHAPQNPDGSLAQPLGKVGREVSPEEAYRAARLTALSVLGDLQRELGDLDRVTAWLRVFGMVNAAPGFTQTPNVINGFSDLIVELWGPEAGQHARSAVGLAELPVDIPVEVEAEVELDGG